MDKTGTTSVQQAFAREAAVLEAQCQLHFLHVFPDRKKFNGNHSPYLRPLFCKFPRARRRLSAMGLTDDEKIDGYNDNTTAALRREFEQKNAENILLSAEVISHFQPEDLQGLASWARGLAEKVTVVACVRHPEHALSSEIQQRLPGHSNAPIAHTSSQGTT
ncbi:hypothetical protein [Halioglobus sp. HI00S01]|uniref:hypothetical protein n=1 Tax=Halioglobus sp. HI00S01 TaxID=1822214 RepID=UPI0012E7D0E5|nr:hypothetical protein [Halioglobus sp. HI00S01]